MRLLLAMLFSLISAASLAADLKLNESAAQPGQWGYRPETGTSSQVNPPSFSWRPQGEIAGWEIQCGRGESFDEIQYAADGLAWNVHCPPVVFPPGEYVWRYRGADKKGKKTAWSKARTFAVPKDAVEMPMPPREELLGRIPPAHPRLFLRPEDLPRLKELVAGPLKGQYDDLVRRCEKLLKNPPPTKEPEKYPPGVTYKDEQWRVMWWGNRTYTIAALDGAATLAFTRLLGGKEEYGQLARRILLDCARWDPKGATGYRYNDEAGMPYAYYFSRTYTFVNDLLSEAERRQCRDVMKVRGDEMYKHLCPRHLWQPYASHSNRAWHFLGEIGIAFQEEIEGADDWAWFAMNVFYNVYPVWCDDDGGWHEGTSYWSSYIDRFTWWADVMRSAMGIDAYRKPYFASVGYYPMYLMPPGKVGGGFGDLTAARKASNNVPLMSVLAAQAGNPYWQWYVEAMGGPSSGGGYVGFIRGALPDLQPQEPKDLPTSRHFRGIGQAYLNSTLLDADDDVQVVFKSSPFGTQSHGYEANNSFLLWAYGERLLIRSGYRDIYGSEHHRDWMWSTRSVNNITVDGHGQVPHSAASQGRIVAFKTTAAIDVVVGEAGEAYRTDPKDDKSRLLDRFTRAILFVKPELVIVFDRLEARQESTYEYWLHAVNEFQADDPRRIEVRAGDVVCPISLLAPEGLTLRQTNQYDPNPRPRIKLREWHLTATTPQPAGKVEFVAVMRPHRKGERVPEQGELKKIDGGYLLKAAVSDGEVVALLPTSDSAAIAGDGLKSTGEIVVEKRTRQGERVETVRVETVAVDFHPRGGTIE